VYENFGIMGSEGFEFIGCADERLPRDNSKSRREKFRKMRRCIKAGANCRAALRNRQQVGGRLPDAPNTKFQLRRIAGEFLAES